MWLDAGVMQPNIVWTAAKGVYAKPIAEHILALILAAARGLPERARAQSWGGSGGRLVAGSTVGVVGSGGIGTEVIGLLASLGVRTIALTRDGRSVPGADLSVGREQLPLLLGQSDYVVLTAALTAETAGLISAHTLALMRPDAWLINIARGGLVDTSALVTALRAGTIGGAALDVTDPSPCPTTTSSGRSRTSSSHRTSPRRPHWGLRFSPGGSRRTSDGSGAASHSSASSTWRWATELTRPAEATRARCWTAPALVALLGRLVRHWP